MRLTMRSDINHPRIPRGMPAAPVPPTFTIDRRRCLPQYRTHLDLGDLFKPVPPSSSRVRIRTNTTPRRKDLTASSADCNRRPFGLGCFSEKRRYGATVRPGKVLHVWFQPSDSARSPSPTRQRYSGSHPGLTEPQSSDSRGSR
ncbi:hypothetical protein QBC45DRAFT_123362 [Copromyces sp. CBS 386.78]|nr:hypothetical protein QBC45DRAFT_123362 [Copromyces sp. CBS 386.78]